MTTLPITRDFDIGRVVRRTFEILKANPGVFAALALMLVAPGYVITGLVTLKYGADNFTAISLISLPTSCVYMLGDGAMILAALRGLEGERAAVGPSLRAAAKRWLALIGLMWIVNILTTLAAILLLFPAFIVATRWSMSVPALLVKGRDPSNAMRLSSDYTTGHRWKIFALGCAYFIAKIVGELILGGLTAWMIEGAAGTGNIWGLCVLTPLFQTLTAPVFAAGIASVYFELRGDRDSGVARVAAVFD